MQVTSITGKKIFEKYNLYVEQKDDEKTFYYEDNISLEDITNLLELKGVAGEKDLVKKIICAAINKNNFGLEGKSGSGKTFILEKIIELLPDVYTLNQTSGVSTFYDSNLINKSQFLYVPELQKAMIGKEKSIIEIIKDLSEGKSATRIITNTSRTGIEKQEINPNITIIYSLATENKFKPDKELERRFIHFNTDNSEAHIKDILENQANSRTINTINKVKEENLKYKIKKYINICLSKKYEIIDPFSKLIVSQLPNVHESITKAKNYLSLVDGHAKFYYQNHVKINFGNQEYIITNISDHKVINQIQNKPFQINENLLNGAKEDIKRLSPEVFNEWFSKQII